MLPKPQQSLQRPSREFNKENKESFSSVVSLVQQPKGLIQRLYSYLQYGVYSLRYLKQRIFSRNESFVWHRAGVSFTADRSSDSIQNQSLFGLEHSINALNQIDLNFRMITTHFTENSANLSLIPANHSLEIQGLIPWTQLMWHYLRKSKAISSQDKKSASTSFFKNAPQESVSEASYVIKHIEKIGVFLFKESEAIDTVPIKIAD